MNILLLCMGKTQEPYLREGILDYEKRLIRYVRFKRLELPDVKSTSSLSFNQIKEKEGNLLLKNVKVSDHLILFDEKGCAYSSKQMSYQIEQHLQRGTRDLVFAIGGSFGFSPDVINRANEMWSHSKLTFPHQLVRLLCVEQLYRCFTIIKGEAYHHE